MSTLPALAAAPAAPSLSGWAVGWDPPEALASLEAHLGRVDALWLRTIALAEDGSVVSVEAPALQRLAAAGAKAGTKVGVMLDNAAGQGFSAERAAKLFANDAALTTLRGLAKSQRWRSFNLDMESLPDELAPQFEAFVGKLVKTLGAEGVRVSVALHAKTGPASPGVGGFQRWPELAKLGVDFVVMAYDHAWSTSPPGPVAPLAWVRDAARYALTVVPADRLIVALPLFGYHWKKQKNGWQGDGRLATELRARVAGAKGLKADATVAAEDGYLFRSGADEAVAFDDERSVALKSRELRRMGVHRLAVWRFGGEGKALYQEAAAP